MARNSNDILREYLVSIGFSVDENQLKKTDDRLKKFTKNALEIGAAFTGVSYVVASFFQSVTNDLEKLYYSSQRTNTTVVNLKAIRYGAEQIGLTADQVSNALEGMARQLRTNPGLLGLLKSLGVEVKGKGMDDVMLNLVQNLKRMPFYQASAIANLFGIDPDTLLMLEKGVDELQKVRAERARMMADAGLTEKDARDAKDFANETRKLGAEWDVFKIQLEKDFLPVASQLLHFLESAVTFLQQADVATAGWSTRIGALVTLLGGLVGAKAALGGLGKLLGLGGGAAAGEAAAGTSLAGAAATAGAVLGTGGVIGGSLYLLLRSIASRRQAEADYRMQVEGYLNDLRRRGQAVPEGTVAAPGSAPIGVRQNNPGNLRRWGGALQQGGFAVFGSAFEGLSAMAQNLLNYFRMGLSSVRSIISRWAPSSENDTASYIADVAKRLGVGADQNLNIRNVGVLRNLMAAMIHHEQGYDPYNLNLIGQAAQFRLGAGGQTAKDLNVQSTTHITVHGSSDPDQTAKQVGGEMRRVNGDLVRNLAGATR